MVFVRSFRFQSAFSSPRGSGSCGIPYGECCCGGGSCLVIGWLLRCLVVSSTVFIGLYAQVSYVFVHCVLCKFLVVSGSVEIER